MPDIQPPRSPFTPGYSKPPLVFGGHEQDLEELRQVFRTGDFGENHTVLLSGLRGAGKTAMLYELREAALENGWMAIHDDAQRGLISRMMDTAIPELINKLTQTERKRLSGLGIWQFSAEFQVTDTARPGKPLLRNDLTALATMGSHRGVLITIDEVTSGRVRMQEVSRLAMEVSHAIGNRAPVMLVFAGIRVDLDALLDGDQTTFLRRSRMVDFRLLHPEAVRHVLVETAQRGGRSFEPEALDLLLRVSQGYPYLVQLLGDYAWRKTPESDVISLEDARHAQRRGVDAVLTRVISRAYADLSDVDRQIVEAMAEDEGRSRVTDLAARLGKTTGYLNVYKKRLVDSGYIEAEGRHHVRFSLPYLRDYIRAMTRTGDDDGSVPGVSPWEAYPPPSL